MSKDIFGIIYAGEENMSLWELVQVRSIGALPIGARYRVIDFVLSDMVNSGLRSVAVIPRRNYHSLIDHLGSGKAWDLNRKKDGLLLIPPSSMEDSNAQYSGMIDSLRGAISYIRRVPQKYCLLAGSNAVYNAKFNEMFEFHKESGADVTILYNDEGNLPICGEFFPDSRLKIDSYGRVIEMKNYGEVDGFGKMSMGAFLINKELLLYLLEDVAMRGSFKSVNDIIMANVSGLKVYGFEHKGYVGRVRSMAAYFKTNMDFLREDVKLDLFQNKQGPIYTKVKDEPPTRYGTNAKIKNSIVGSGCLIEGTVENSILFRDITIAKGAVIKDSIIMQSSVIFSNATLSGAILDKRVTVRPNATLSGSPEYPIVIPKGASV